MSEPVTSDDRGKKNGDFAILWRIILKAQQKAIKEAMKEYEEKLFKKNQVEKLILDDILFITEQEEKLFDLSPDEFFSVLDTPAPECVFREQTYQQPQNPAARDAQEESTGGEIVLNKESKPIESSTEENIPDAVTEVLLPVTTKGDAIESTTADNLGVATLTLLLPPTIKGNTLAMDDVIRKRAKSPATQESGRGKSIESLPVNTSAMKESVGDINIESSLLPDGDKIAPSLDTAVERHRDKGFIKPNPKDCTVRTSSRKRKPTDRFVNAPSDSQQLSTSSRRQTKKPRSCALVSYEDHSDENLNHCHICGNVGKLLCCHCCPRSYHLSCLDPTTNTSPHDWRCNRCKTEANLNEDDEVRGDKHILKIKRLFHKWSKQSPESHFEGMSRIFEMVLKLKHYDFGKVFSTPVKLQNQERMRCYSIVIQKPMDLGTILKKFKSSTGSLGYAGSSDTQLLNVMRLVLDDIETIWSNCFKFNKERSLMYRMGKVQQLKYSNILKRSIFQLVPCLQQTEKQQIQLPVSDTTEILKSKEDHNRTSSRENI
eukprot:CAMPEP_0194287882 /NCGR_PEP_ID=MMETSP0169-20130528/35686_1 /TAXON_ID=218684 /ORGANISM="Corethron pennatum, Strain L29A3" /LENGTH=543 /DNA_ID=CAMNT_0039034725 /DNA_START=196 /DNA_END=1827 /DNA_ORIENTATION=-